MSVRLPAGIMGYAWVAILHYWLQLSYTTTLLIATGMPAVWLVVVHSLMQLSKPSSKAGPHYTGLPSTAGECQPAHTYEHTTYMSVGCDGPEQEGVRPVAILPAGSARSALVGTLGGAPVRSTPALAVNHLQLLVSLLLLLLLPLQMMAERHCSGLTAA